MTPIIFSDIDATPADFGLSGGQYSLQIVAGTWGTATLNQIGPDGSTLLPVGSAISANGQTLFTVGGGQFQLTLSGASGLYARISAVNVNAW